MSAQAAAMVSRFRLAYLPRPGETKLTMPDKLLILPADSKTSYHQPYLKEYFVGRGTGDSGKSSLFNNERRWKDDDAFTALGTTDELSSLLGVCGEKARADGLEDVHEVLKRLQCCLQDLGAHFATPPNSTERKKNMTFIDKEMVDWIHAEVDRFGDVIPPIRQFILSGGGETSATIQYARAVCRRAERSVVPLIRDEQVDPQALKFLNRMSDLLFVLGRYCCFKTNNEELTYLRPKEFTAMKWQRKKLGPQKD